DEANNPKLYTCDEGSKTSRCLFPAETTFEDLINQTDASGRTQYTGLVWYIASALLEGAKKVTENEDLPDETKAILNGSGYPLYRLINLAAVYPGMTTELLQTYSAAIAVQYTIDTLDKVARP